MELFTRPLRYIRQFILGNHRSNTNNEMNSITHNQSESNALAANCLDSNLETNPDQESVPMEIDQIDPTPDEESKNEGSELNICPICMDTIVNLKQLDKCGHNFCSDCIDQYFNKVKPQCPCCFVVYGVITGDQPSNGSMTYKMTNHRLPGYENDSEGSIEIYYHIPDGIQDSRHPNPGIPYQGTRRRAFLPNNPEGRLILTLLRRAFELGLTFTIGQSRVSGADNVITWNDIHHKTSYHGGPSNFGYPDPTYLNRVRQELAAKGIV